MNYRVYVCHCMGELFRYQMSGFFLLGKLSLVFCLWPDSMCYAHGKNTEFRI